MEEEQPRGLQKRSGAFKVGQGRAYIRSDRGSVLRCCGDGLLIVLSAHNVEEEPVIGDVVLPLLRSVRSKYGPWIRILLLQER